MHYKRALCRGIWHIEMARLRVQMFPTPCLPPPLSHWREKAFEKSSTYDIGVNPCFLVDAASETLQMGLDMRYYAKIQKTAILWLLDQPRFMPLYCSSPYVLSECELEVCKESLVRVNTIFNRPWSIHENCYLERWWTYHSPTVNRIPCVRPQHWLKVLHASDTHKVTMHYRILLMKELSHTDF